MTDRYAVIGNPVAHSKSPQIHAAFARLTFQDMAYEAILAPRDGFAEAVRAFAAAGGRGMNVTVPFKLEAHAVAGTRSPRAEAAQAVNTLVFSGSGIHGDNTDGVGLLRDITIRKPRAAITLPSSSARTCGECGSACRSASARSSRV